MSESEYPYFGGKSRWNNFTIIYRNGLVHMFKRHAHNSEKVKAVPCRLHSEAFEPMDEGTH